MANPKTQIEVSVLDKASSQLKAIKDRMGAMADTRLGGALANLAKKTVGASKVLGAYTIVGAAAGAWGLGMASKFTSTLMSTATEYDRYRTTLEGVEKTSANTKKAMAWLGEYSAKNGGELDDLTKAWVRLKTRGMDPLANGLFDSVNNVATALKRPVLGVVDAIADAINGSGAKLKNYGIDVKKMGKKFEYSYDDKNGVRQTGSANINNKDQIKSTIQTIWNNKYGGAMDQMSGSWEGMMASIGGQWTRFKMLIADAGLFDFLKDKLGGLLARIDEMSADGSLQKLAETIGTKLANGVERAWDLGNKFYDKFVEINDFMGGFENTILVVAGVLALPLVAALGSVTVALFGVGAALLATPVGWFFLAIAGIVGLVALIKSNWGPISEWFSGLWDDICDFASAAMDTLKNIFLYFTPVGWVVLGMTALYDYFSNNMDDIGSSVEAALETIKNIFLTFTPLGWVINGFVALSNYVANNWDDIKNIFKTALVAIGLILSGFLPLNLLRPAFESLKNYLSGVWAGIKEKLDWIPNVVKKVIGIDSRGSDSVSDSGGGGGRPALRLPSGPPSLRQPGQSRQAEAHVTIDFKDMPKGTRTASSAGRGVSLTQKQGYVMGS